MTTTGRQANNPQDVKEIDMVKESISDIINQLQDIDPARLSFSPFLDLDTQISLAPVSDSPESSVEELRSSSHSVTGSQHSLVPLSAGKHCFPKYWSIFNILIWVFNAEHGPDNLIHGWWIDSLALVVDHL